MNPFFSPLAQKGQKAVRTLKLRAQARTLLARSGRRPDRRGPALLVCCLAQMGDVVLSAGVAAALRDRFPNSPLLFAGQGRWLEILDGDPATDGLLDARSLFEVRALARTGLFETVYVLDIPVPTLLSYLDGVPHIFRYQAPTTADWFRQGRHLLALYEQNAGLPEGMARPRVWVRPEDRQAARAILNGAPPAAGPSIALQAVSSRVSKDWPLERLADLIGRWTARDGARFWIVGGPDEADALAGLPQVTHLAGRLTLKQSAALIAQCDLFVGPDSGLAYVAEAVGTPGLILLGPTVPQTCGPRGPDFAFVRAPVSCHPPCHGPCREVPFCISRLDVDTVDRALQTVWGRVQGQKMEGLCRSL